MSSSSTLLTRFHGWLCRLLQYALACACAIILLLASALYHLHWMLRASLPLATAVAPLVQPASHMALAVAPWVQPLIVAVGPTLLPAAQAAVPLAAASEPSITKGLPSHFRVVAFLWMVAANCGKLAAAVLRTTLIMAVGLAAVALHIVRASAGVALLPLRFAMYASQRCLHPATTSMRAAVKCAVYLSLLLQHAVMAASCSFLYMARLTWWVCTTAIAIAIYTTVSLLLASAAATYSCWCAAMFNFIHLPIYVMRAALAIVLFWWISIMKLNLKVVGSLCYYCLQSFGLC